MGGKSFIPGPDDEFDGYFKKYCQYVNTKCTGTPPEWNHIPENRRTELISAFAAWHTAFVKLDGAHTHADVFAKDEARKTSAKTLEEFNNQYILYAREVSNVERTEIGAHVHDTTPTPIGKPATRPVFIIRLTKTRVLLIVFHDELTPKSRARPYGMNGAVISWAVAEAGQVITDFKQLTHTILATSSSQELVFEERDRGKTVYIALQWQNETGERGEPTEIQSAIIP